MGYEGIEETVVNLSSSSPIRGSLFEMTLIISFVISDL